ncbi:hypothetical protein [Microbispora amethystogenes]|uniref:Uncharacterized protein n=1 Tax=Microbispora amethystogenes TaxID=1427754 RepID=A0ABQ4FE44_9ACTN|nr:hypothetical protein [Microbispora amethystogenes]GIH33086.1 hypothetical protein Mam01_32500 [Microbispora amethystogenes]
MRNVDEVNELLRPLARVEPGQPDSRASGTGARALLASITAQEPGVVPRGPGRARRHTLHGPRRLALGVTAAVALATGIVVGPSLLGGRGAAVSYANSAMEIHLEGDQYVARIKDPFADHDKYTQAFHAVGLNVDLRPVPTSPNGVGKILGMIIADRGSSRPDPEATPDPSGPRFNGVPLSMETTPRGCQPGLDDHCIMVMRIPAGFTGDVDVRLGRQAKPGEEYANFDSAMAPGEMFDGVRLREGRPVADILAEARKRNLTVVFSLIRMDAKTGSMSSFDPLPADRVGPGWIVWNAWQVKAGVIRLLVTPDRLPENPFYNGSAPPPAS